MSLAGNVNIGGIRFSGGTFNLSSFILGCAGDFVMAGGTFTCNTGTVNFNSSSSTQYINVTSFGSTIPQENNITFYNFSASGVDVRTYCDVSDYSISITGTLTISGLLKSIEK